MNNIYLDHNATTPVYPEVLEAMLPFLQDEFGNPSSLHRSGQRARKAVEEARQKVAAFINAADPNEIIFTSGGTESNNLAIKGTVETQSHQGRRIVTTAIEHAAIRQTVTRLRDDGKISATMVGVPPDGVIKSEDIKSALTADTILVSLMAVNNEIGTIQPVSELASECQRRGIYLHTDAVQAAGRVKIDVQAWGVDMLSLSGHKMGASKGVGVLYVKKGTRLARTMEGGGQEKNRRGGTENVPGIVGLGAAAEISGRRLDRDMPRLKTLRDRLESSLLKNIPSSFINGSRECRVANTSNICFEYTDNSELMMALDVIGLSCSNGSACASGNPLPSHVLLALGLSQEKAHASLRFSLGHTTREDDVERAIPMITNIVANLREHHPLWKEAVGH